MVEQQPQAKSMGLAKMSEVSPAEIIAGIAQRDKHFLAKNTPILGQETINTIINTIKASNANRSATTGVSLIMA